MRAFSSGAVALTGVEAISNGVPAFRKPEPRNAATTLVWMGVDPRHGVLRHLGARPPAPARRSARTRRCCRSWPAAVFGDGAFMYFVFQAATAGILLLAANTAFAGFPQIASILARDGYLPRQLHNRGDRLVFSNGIIALAVIAGLLIVAFGGVTTALIPLYAVGVFCGFTPGPVRACACDHQPPPRTPGWQRGFAINLVGAITTGLVLLVVVVSKFTIGAWIPVVVIPIIAFVLTRVKRHYDRVERGAGARRVLPQPPPHPHRRGAGRPRAPGHDGRAQLRPVAGPGPARRPVGGARRTATPSKLQEQLGALRHPRVAPDRLVALPRARHAGAAVPRRARRRARERHHHRRSSRSSCSPSGGSSCSTTSRRCC